MTILIGIGVAAVVIVLLPSITFGTEFFTLLDAAIAMIINLLDLGRYFIPLDVLSMCFGIILMVDNWSLVVRIFQDVAQLIRG